MTGSGKGLQMADIANDVLIRGKKCLVVMRRRSLIFQTHENFKNYIDLDCSIIMGSHKKLMDPLNPIQITSIDTLSRRLLNSDYSFLKEFDVVIIDEAHDTTSPSYAKFFDFMGDKIYIGFTATPYTVSGKPLSFWTDYVLPIHASELRNQGYLCDIDIYAPKEQISTDGIRKINGDFNQKDLYDEASNSKIIGDIVKNYQKFGNDLPAILFAVNIEHSKLMEKTFNQFGIPAIHCDQSDKKEVRDKAVSDLESGKVKILCNVNIFSTGIDIPFATVCIMARPTMSEVLFIQQVGRVLRNPPGKKKAILIDHAGNCFRHGMPYDIREPCIGNSKPKMIKKEFSVKTCKKCFAVLPPSANECYLCGSTLKLENKSINHVDGELTKIENSKTQVAPFSSIKKQLIILDHVGAKRGWKDTAKYFKLYNVFGDQIFRYEKELGLPTWLKKVITPNISVT